VGYPIIPLTDLDTLGYLHRLEEVIIQTLSDFQINAGRVNKQTGAWVFGNSPEAIPAKIASIGVRVDANRITQHGFALNISPEMSHWEGILACGLENQAKISMSALLEETVQVQQVIPHVIDSFCNVFGYQSNLRNLPDPPDFLKHGKV